MLQRSGATHWGDLTVGAGWGTIHLQCHAASRHCLLFAYTFAQTSSSPTTQWHLPPSDLLKSLPCYQRHNYLKVCSLPDVCHTARGKEECLKLSRRLDDAFRHLLKKRLSYEKADDILTNVYDIRAALKPISTKYNVEYFSSLKLYSEHCWIKFGELTWQYLEVWQLFSLNSQMSTWGFQKRFLLFSSRYVR